MHRWVVLAICATLALAGCDDDDTPAEPTPDGALPDGGEPPDGGEGPDVGEGPDGATPDAMLPPPVVLADDGPVSLAVDARGITLRYGESTRLVLPADGVQIGVVPELVEATNYDPYYIYSAAFALPAGLTWHGGVRLTPRLDGEALTVDVEHGDAGTSALRFELMDGRVAARWTPPAGSTTAYFRLRARIDPAEGIYGLGQVLDSPNHRGHVRAMQLEVDDGVESSNNEANVPVPLAVGSTGWGLFVESLYPAAFAVAVEADDLLDVAVGKGIDSADGLAFHLLADAHPLDISRHYYAITGFPGLPAKWALGPIVWRDENDDQAQVVSDIEAMRDLDMAANGYWIDRPYASGVSAFDFNPGQFPEPQAMIDRMHELGYRFALWHTGYIGEEQEATAEFHQQAVDGGYYPPEVGPILNRWGRPVDFTHPEAYAWFQDLIRRYTDMGVEGFKLDYMQDIVLGLFRARTVWHFADGSDERTMHKAYQTLYHKVFAELLPPDGGFLLTRTGTWGGQIHGNIIWPGDLDANFARHKQPMVDPRDGEAYIAVGGLPASMVAGLSLSGSGYPFYGADTGGYRHCPPDKETFIRWFQQTSLSSVMQIGTSCNDVAWEPTEDNGFDAEVLDLYRIFVRLHLRLWPYAWTMVEELGTTGRPLQRPFGLQHPELGDHRWDVYFFGDDLLVAPVVERGAVQKAVPFPPGDWLDWWTGARVEGGEERTVEAPLQTLPLYLRAGGIVAMLRPTIDTMAPTVEPERVDSFDTDPGRLWVRIGAGADGGDRLFDGTVIGWADAVGEATLAAGETFDRGWQLEIVGRDATAVEVDGQPVDRADDIAALDAVEAGWTIDGARGQVIVRVPPGGRTVRLR